MPINIPIAPPLTFNDSTSASSSYLQNGIVEIDGAGREYVTQRPAFNQEIDASATLASAAGRGLYYWGAVSAYYYAVNNGTSTTIYKGNYATACTGTLGTGNSKVYFVEVGSYLCIIDVENNKGYTIASGASTTVNEITDVDFPPKQTPSLQLARGAVELKGRLYIMDTEGTIWNSASQDPTSWAGGDNIQAEIEQDGGVAIAKHNEQIVAFGERTIEYFVHAGNPTNSPLSSNQTVYHEIGAVDQDMLFNDNKVLYFIGQSRTATLGVYRMKDFAIEKISTPGMDVKITNELDSSFTGVYASGLTAEGREFYVINSGGGRFVFDGLRNRWYRWVIRMGTGSNQLLVDWTIQTANQAGYGLLYNGDVVSLTNDFVPYDISADDASEDIQVTILTSQMDFGTRNRKFLSNIRANCVISGATTSPWNAVISIYVDGSSPATSLGTIDVTDYGAMIPTGGSFYTAAFFMVLPNNAPTGTSKRFFLYSVDADIAGGLH